MTMTETRLSTEVPSPERLQRAAASGGQQLSDGWPSERVRRDLHWVSVFLRLCIGSLFLSAGLMKLSGGVSGTVAYYSSLFEHSLLPAPLVRAHASVILFAELGLGAWLGSGLRLALAWKVAAALLSSLAIGMLFAGKYDVASDNYLYVLLSLGGLLVSRFDRWTLGASDREGRLGPH